MDDLVEKVARAIEISDGGNPSGSLWKSHKGNARAAIRAVLDAIAEPSDAMQERGAEEISGNDGFAAFDYPGEAIRVWRAMIAALRKELGQ